MPSFTVSPTQTQQAAQHLLAGKLLAYPTEAVWGLGCNPFSYSAVQDLLNLKGRAEAKGLILLFANAEQLKPYLANPCDIENLQSSSEEQATSYIIEVKANTIPHWIMGKHGTLAIRICQHPQVQAIIQATQLPLVSTSLNPQGNQPASQRMQVWRYFAKAIKSGLLKLSQGSIGKACKPSRIIVLKTGEIIRH